MDFLFKLIGKFTVVLCVVNASHAEGWVETFVTCFTAMALWQLMESDSKESQ